MITVGNITGTVSIGLDGHDEHSIATFEIPVTTTLDRDTGIAHLESASVVTIKHAAIEALINAAEQLLDSLPTVDAEELDSTPGEHGHTATCDTCGTQITSEGPATLEHADNGAHDLTPHHH